MDLDRTPLDAMLLAVLDEEPVHGYAVIERLRERSAGSFDLPEGTVYPALHRLERAGRLHATWTTADGRRRKTYALTGKGRTTLDRRRADWHAYTRAVGAVLR
jgi:PadR family transcriptional regulator, regulatory protein PadR